ncbi:MAG: energy transducer TonB [Cytophagales bacterium]|nr:energy transducer TonB [Hyphobacterium sp. CCMP332]
MKIWLTFAFVIFALSLSAQEVVPADTSKSYVTYGPEPSFPGGLEAFYKFVQKELETLDLDGTSSDPAWVKFLVDKDGTIIKVVILESPDKGYENAIRDMFKRMPKWQPARREGEFVISEMTLPIFFN